MGIDPVLLSVSGENTIHIPGQTAERTRITGNFLVVAAHDRRKKFFHYWRSHRKNKDIQKKSQDYQVEYSVCPH